MQRHSHRNTSDEDDPYETDHEYTDGTDDEHEDDYNEEHEDEEEEMDDHLLEHFFSRFPFPTAVSSQSHAATQEEELDEAIQANFTSPTLTQHVLKSLVEEESETALVQCCRYLGLLPEVTHEMLVLVTKRLSLSMDILEAAMPLFLKCKDNAPIPGLVPTLLHMVPFATDGTRAACLRVLGRYAHAERGEEVTALLLEGAKEALPEVVLYLRFFGDVGLVRELILEEAAKENPDAIDALQYIELSSEQRTFWIEALMRKEHFPQAAALMQIPLPWDQELALLRYRRDCADASGGGGTIKEVLQRQFDASGERHVEREFLKELIEPGSGKRASVSDDQEELLWAAAQRDASIKAVLLGDLPLEVVRFFAMPLRMPYRFGDKEGSIGVDLLMPAQSIVEAIVGHSEGRRLARMPTLTANRAATQDTALLMQLLFQNGPSSSYVPSLASSSNLDVVIRYGSKRAFRCRPLESVASRMAAAIAPGVEWRHLAALPGVLDECTLEVHPRDKRDANEEDAPMCPSFDDDASLGDVLRRLKVPSVRLSGRMMLQLSCPLMACLLCIPPAARFLVEQYPHVLSHEAKCAFMRRRLLGTARALHELGMEHVVLPLAKHRISFARDSTVADLTRLLSGAPRDAVLEVQFPGEEGTGSGPTAEFYEVAAKLLRDQLPWMHASTGGLYPAASMPDLKALGLLMERAILDKQTIALDLCDAFFEQCLGKRDAIMERVDEQLARGLADKSALLGLPYDLSPITRQQGPKEEGPPIDVVITEGNVDQFVEEAQKAVSNSRCFESTRELLRHYLYAYATSTLPLFTSVELRRLVCGQEHMEWTLDGFLGSVKCAHGYTVDAPQIRWLAEWVVGLNGDGEMQSRLLRWLTGRSRLPSSSGGGGGNTATNATGTTGVLGASGGWESLDPPLTIVPRQSSPNNVVDLPSVMTCVNYLKLPRYATRELLVRCMLVAITEGADSFCLS